MIDNTFIHILEILGTVAFASSGATRAIRKKYDAFGLFVLAFVASIGGGTLRDILIGNTPVEWLNDSTLILTVISATLLTYLFNSYMQKLRVWMSVFDAIGLGLFTMVGVQKGLEHELSIFICVLLGTITASFGGVIRDILSGETPLLLQKEIYALASISGGVLFFVLRYFSVPMEIIYPVCVVQVVGLRLLAYFKGWSLTIIK